MVVGAVLAVLAFGLHSAASKPALEAWHRYVPPAELTAAKAGEVADLAAYRALEARLFAEVDLAMAEAESADGGARLDRFDRRSPSHPSRFGPATNRTWEVTPEGPPIGHVLLLHGLSDGPHSLRAVGGRLAAAGFHVVGLRLPGHGTVPGALTRVHRDDWRAAVRLGVDAAVGSGAGPDEPFVVVGYSNGAGLALDLTLDALLDGHGPVPDRLVLLSPAMAVSGAAALSRWADLASRLPGLEPLAWHSVEPEFDPVKYNSFPMNAGAQIHALLEEIGVKLERFAERVAVHENDGSDELVLPPILTIQSVVDATVPPVESLTTLYGHVRAGESELVLFDANRRSVVDALLGPEAGKLLALAEGDRTFPFHVTLVTNASPETDQVVAFERAAGGLETTEVALDLAWPDGVFSLSHVAIPFPPDDRIYGIERAPQDEQGDEGVAPRSVFPLGALAVKGERGVLEVPDSLLQRLRSNPFYPYVETRILRFLHVAAADPESEDAEGAA